MSLIDRRHFLSKYSPVLFAPAAGTSIDPPNPDPSAKSCGLDIHAKRVFSELWYYNIETVPDLLPSRSL
jgi:hypothetical protein